MGWQPGEDDGSGAVPDPDPGVPSARDPRLAEFAFTAGAEAPKPSAALAVLADELCGPERRSTGATDNELVGLLRAWAALESWAAGAKLGVVRELIRCDGVPSPGSDHGDLPETWSQSLRYELAQALACSTQSAETTIWLAWELQGRLPGIGALLDDGTLTLPKARAVIDTFKYLMDAEATAAEALILDQLAGKTYTQVLRLAEWAALTVDPDLAERRRRHAQKKNARVTFFREDAGTAGLSGRDLPPDAALVAMANVTARAEEYAESGAFGDTAMDVLRAQAYLDLLNGVPAADRVACAEPQDERAEAAESLAWAKDRAARAADRVPGGPTENDDEADGDDSADGANGGGDGPGSGPGGPGLGGPGQEDSPAGPERQPRPADLVVPLTTLLGLAERPGEIHRFGLLDPGLARELAAAGAASPRTEVCVTVTSPEGYAIGHGCARIDRTKKPLKPDPPVSSGTGLPARLNLTIQAAALPGLTDPPGQAGGESNIGTWVFAPRSGSGPPGSIAPHGFGTWTLTIPGGRRFTVRLDPVPVYDCDHHYESAGYQPSDRLRHLVQVRDGTCTFPSCNRHARETDFEHALPYHQGGRTCACNAGARSRACHRVKQSPGWTVTQPKPGWHQWQTPAGRTYTQEPKRYPA